MVSIKKEAVVGVVVKRVPTTFPVGPMDVTRNYMRVPGDFVGELTLKGEVKKPAEKIIINGVERVNEDAPRNAEPINYKYNVSDAGIVKVENRAGNGLGGGLNNGINRQGLNNLNFNDNLAGNQNQVDRRAAREKLLRQQRLNDLQQI